MSFKQQVVLYGPSLALSSVTPLSTAMSILLIGLVCTFYTSIVSFRFIFVDINFTFLLYRKGGLKSVLATDIIQVIMMYAGLLLVIFRVSIYGISLVEIFEIFSIDSYVFRLSIWLAASVKHLELRTRMDEFNFSSKKIGNFHKNLP